MKNERGQALLEYAVIMPLFLFIMMGVIQLSLIISARITLKYASFCAARAALSAEHLINEGVILEYPDGVDYAGDVEKGEATEAALMVLAAIPTTTSTPGVNGDHINLPGWGDLRNTSALRSRLKVDLFSIDNPDPGNINELTNLRNSVTSADKAMYEPITAKLEYDMELLFPNFSLLILGVFDGGLFGDNNTITLHDSCTLVRTKVSGI